MYYFKGVTKVVLIYISALSDFYVKSDCVLVIFLFCGDFQYGMYEIQHITIYHILMQIVV